VHNGTVPFVSCVVEQACHLEPAWVDALRNDAVHETLHLQRPGDRLNNFSAETLSWDFLAFSGPFLSCQQCPAVVFASTYC